MLELSNKIKNTEESEIEIEYNQAINMNQTINFADIKNRFFDESS